MAVVWQKNTQNNEWFDLLRLDLDAPYFKGRKGVFVIWYVTTVAKVIRIGSGNLAEQLKNLRDTPSILQYSTKGKIKVAWVSVNGILQESQMRGVEAFLYDSYNPIEGERPNAPSIVVNRIGQ